MIPKNKLEQETIQNYRISSRCRRLQKQSLLAVKQMNDPAIQQTDRRILVRLSLSENVVPKIPLSATQVSRQSRIQIPEFKFHRKYIAEK